MHLEVLALTTEPRLYDRAWNQRGRLNLRIPINLIYCKNETMHLLTICISQLLYIYLHTNKKYL